MRRVVGTAIVIGSLVLSLHAWQASEAPPMFRSGVDVVRLDVSVLDKNRRPVTGLAAADFTVLEDGKPRPIVTFTPVDLPEAAPARPNMAAWTREVAPDITSNAAPPDGRLVVIMFDWSIRFRDQQIARRIARAAIDDLGPNDQAAVVFSSPLANAGGKQDFTADRARLTAAINRPITVPPDSETALGDPEGYESTDCLCRLCVMDAVTGISNTIRDVPGRRKLLVFIGTFFQGFELATPVPGIPTMPGRSPYTAYYNGGVTPTASGVSEGICAGQLKESMDKMKRAAGLANLTIDTFDPSGLTTPFDDPNPKNIPKRLADLHIMPDATGGRTIVATNEPERQVPDVLSETDSYYLVGFARGSAANDGRLHDISVKVNRPGVTVRTRSGYVATAALAAAEAPGSVSIARSISGALPDGGLPLEAAVAVFAPTTRTAAHASVAVTIGVHEPSSTARPPITAAARAAAAPRHVLVGLFDTNGRSLAKAEQTVTTTAIGASQAGAAFEVLSILPAAPGHYEIRAAVDGGVDGRGSVYTFVDVPDFAKEPLSLSGILVHTVPAMPIAVPAEIKAVLPAVPTARRTFDANEHVTASLRLYQKADDTPESVAITTRIVDAHDQTMFTKSAAIDMAGFQATRAADYAVDVPMNSLGPGEYLLTIEATAGSHTVRRDVRFTRSAVAGAR